MTSPGAGPPQSAGPDNYKALFDNMSEGFVVCEAIRDTDGKLRDYWIRDANPVFLKRAPSGRDMLNRTQLSIRPTTPHVWFQACDRALAGKVVRFEFQDPVNGRWYEVHMARLSEADFGQFFVDVTDRKQAEHRQAQLFDELNHRVKNNLMIVSSLLELQSRTSAVEVRQHLSKAVDRIHSIADLHGALYQHNRTDGADLQPYLQHLCRRLAQSLFPAERVSLLCACDVVTLTVEQAVGVGLMVNELVTNAAKHAFPGNRSGEVRVKVRRDADQLRLIVSDNGQGFREPTRPSDDGLGLRVVSSLAKGMGGTVQLSRGQGGAWIEVGLPLADVVEDAGTQRRLL